MAKLYSVTAHCNRLNGRPVIHLQRRHRRNTPHHKHDIHVNLSPDLPLNHHESWNDIRQRGDFIDRKRIAAK